MNELPPRPISWIVRSGDTLSQIAAAHRVSIGALLAANPACRANPDLIHVGQAIVLPSAPQPQTPGSSPASPAPLPVSERATQLILACEVSSEQEYRRTGQSPSWPQGASGVTIGIGYDLGYVSAAQFRADWATALPEPTLARLATVCGITGAAARQPAAALSDIVVPWAAATAMFLGRSLPETASRTQAALPGTAALPADSFGALVSLTYNRGACFAATGDRYREMRAIHDAMTQQNFAVIPDQFRAMKRLWQGIPGMAGLVDRREQEAKLFQDGLDGK